MRSDRHGVTLDHRYQSTVEFKSSAWRKGFQSTEWLIRIAVSSDKKIDDVIAHTIRVIPFQLWTWHQLVSVCLLCRVIVYRHTTLESPAFISSSLFEFFIRRTTRLIRLQSQYSTGYIARYMAIFSVLFLYFHFDFIANDDDNDQMKAFTRLCERLVIGRHRYPLGESSAPVPSTWTQLCVVMNWARGLLITVYDDYCQVLCVFV